MLIGQNGRTVAMRGWPVVVAVMIAGLLLSGVFLAVASLFAVVWVGRVLGAMLLGVAGPRPLGRAAAPRRPEAARPAASEPPPRAEEVPPSGPTITLNGDARGTWTREES